MADLSALITELHHLRNKGLHIPLEFGTRSDVGTAVPLIKLLSGTTLKFLIYKEARRMNSDNLVAAASLFQKRYTSVLLASVMHPFLAGNIGILADLTHTQIVLIEDMPAGILLDPSVTWFETTDDQESFTNLLYQAVFNDNLGHLIYRIAAEMGLSPLIMWGNVGNYVGYLYEQFSKEPLSSERARRILDSLLNKSGFDAPPLSSTYQTVKLDELESKEAVRVRSTCCLWYQFPGAQPCATCPRLTPSERAEVLSKSKVKK